MVAQDGLKGKIWPVIRVASGNFLEMYDFQIFGYYASAIAVTFFPSGNEYASLMAALATFGVGFLMRPLGALLLGTYIDHRGRRAGLLLTLGLMSAGTLSIACTPSYASIGLLAPLLVLASRLVQGLSAGCEAGGVSVYLSEIATSGRKGLYVSYSSGSQQLAVISTAALGLLLSARLSANDMMHSGWRIPMLAGCLIIPVLFLLRRSLEETPAFITRKYKPVPREILRSLAANWRLVLLAIMLATPNSVYFYMITVYTPTFGNVVLHLPPNQTMAVTLYVGVSSLLWLPIMGSLSDRIGRRPLLFTGTALAAITAYPALSWLGSGPSFSRLLEVELWFSCLYGIYAGASHVFLTEIMPVEICTTGYSFAHSSAIAVFGGFTPAICTYLIHVSGNRAAPGLWMSLAAACGMIAASLLSRERVARAAAAGAG
jgi:MFS family permease